MTKTELEKQLAEALEVSQTEARDILNSVLDEITHSLSAGNDISLPGFGSFVVSERQARQGRNPQTGLPIQIPASKSVRFKPGVPLKKRIADAPVSA